jgi:hypothetical protein
MSGPGTYKRPLFFCRRREIPFCPHKLFAHGYQDGSNRSSAGLGGVSWRHYSRHGEQKRPLAIPASLRARVRHPRRTPLGAYAEPCISRPAQLTHVPLSESTHMAGDPICEHSRRADIGGIALREAGAAYGSLFGPLVYKKSRRQLRMKPAFAHRPRLRDGHFKLGSVDREMVRARAARTRRPNQFAVNRQPNNGS